MKPCSHITFTTDDGEIKNDQPNIGYVKLPYQCSLSSAIAVQSHRKKFDGKVQAHVYNTSMTSVSPGDQMFIKVDFGQIQDAFDAPDFHMKGVAITPGLVAFGAKAHMLLGEIFVTCDYKFEPGTVLSWDVCPVVRAMLDSKYAVEKPHMVAFGTINPCGSITTHNQGEGNFQVAAKLHLGHTVKVSTAMRRLRMCNQSFSPFEPVPNTNSSKQKKRQKYR
jgi:hypothetical protein